ncbi:GNAT family N-acetyltransferase [Metabacillus sp. 84]
MKETFDAEARRWLADSDPFRDFNIQPPGYRSIHMTEYSIQELSYYKILHQDKIAGGLILTISGNIYGRIDRIFVSPSLQGKGIGSKALQLLEKEFPQVTSWELETSSRQLNNHYFYEKAGFQKVYESEDEFCYEKRMDSEDPSVRVRNQDLSGKHYEDCRMAGSKYYKVDLASSSIGNSNVMNTHFSNCNMSGTKFQNINFRSSLLADLNLSGSRFDHVTMGGVQFKDTSLDGNETPLTFERCDLAGVRMAGCSLKGAEIDQCDVSDMKINGISVQALFEAYERTVNSGR